MQTLETGKDRDQTGDGHACVEGIAGAVEGGGVTEYEHCSSSVQAICQPSPGLLARKRHQWEQSAAERAASPFQNFLVRGSEMT
eukprot:scaffold70479_cov12-Tisochrysis_lutea.AAC.1